MNDPLTLPCGCRVRLKGSGRPSRYFAHCEEGVRLLETFAKGHFTAEEERRSVSAYRAHFDSQLRAAREAVKREVVATLEGLASDDPAEFEKARTSEMGQMVREAARKRGME